MQCSTVQCAGQNTVQRIATSSFLPSFPLTLQLTKSRVIRSHKLCLLCKTHLHVHVYLRQSSLCCSFMPMRLPLPGWHYCGIFYFHLSLARPHSPAREASKRRVHLLSKT